MVESWYTRFSPWQCLDTRFLPGKCLGTSFSPGGRGFLYMYCKSYTKGIQEEFIGFHKFPSGFLTWAPGKPHAYAWLFPGVQVNARHMPGISLVSRSPRTTKSLYILLLCVATGRTPGFHQAKHPAKPWRKLGCLPGNLENAWQTPGFCLVEISPKP